MLVVCFLCSPQASAEDGPLATFFKQKKHTEFVTAGVQDEVARAQAGIFVQSGPIGGFENSNPALAAKLADLLKSGDVNQIQKAETFFTQLQLSDIRNKETAVTNAVNAIDALQPGLSADDKTKLKDYLNSTIGNPRPDGTVPGLATLAQLQTQLRSGLPPKPPASASTLGTTGGQVAGATAGNTGGTTAGATAGTTAGKPPLSEEERQRQAAQDALLQAQLAQAQQSLQNGGRGGGGSGGGGGGGGGKGGGAGGAGSPPSFGNSQNNSDVGSQVAKHTQDQRSKEADRGLLNNNNNSFGNNNNSSSSDPKKDPFKKDDKDGGFKLPEPKTDKNASKTVSKPGAGKTDPLSDPSGDAAQGPGVGYNSNLTLAGPTKVPGLAPKPDISAMLAAGGGGGGGGGDNPFAGANIKGGGSAGAASFEGNPFSSNEGMGGGGGMGGPAFRKISPESGSGSDGESVESSSGGATNDFRKKGSILDQIMSFGPSDEERLKNLGIMAFVARPERICTLPGKSLLGNCPTKNRTRRIISREDDE